VRENTTALCLRIRPEDKTKLEAIAWLEKSKKSQIVRKAIALICEDYEHEHGVDLIFEYARMRHGQGRSLE
jgi:hypothetical protein